MRRSLRHFRKSVFLALEHDVLNTAKAAAYSGMLMFFPAFIVLTALIAKAPEGPTVVGEIRWVSTQILPADTVHLMLSTMQARNSHQARLITSGLSLSVFAGLGLMLTLMEGFRRAYRLPRNEWLTSDDMGTTRFILGRRCGWEIRHRICRGFAKPYQFRSRMI